MTMRVNIWVLAGCLASTVPAEAQAPPTDQTYSDTQRADERDVVGTTTVGDVGLWFVPLADTNGRGLWRGSAARTSRNTAQGHLNVANFTASASYGLWERADVFVSWDAVARVDRDVRPLYIADDPEQGGVDPAAPFARDTWSGNQFADLRIGAKVKVLDEHGSAPVSFAIRGVGRLPTGDYQDGGGVGAPAFDLDAIVSRWVNSRLVLTGSVGGSQRNNPKEPVEVRVPPLFDWGAGVGVLPFRTLLLHAEMTGEKPLKRETTDLSHRLMAADGSMSPMHSQVEHHQAVIAGMTWMGRSGLFLGAAARWDFPMEEPLTGTRLADYTDIQVRLGWRPTTRTQSLPPSRPMVPAMSEAVAPPPEPPPVPPPAPAPERVAPPAPDTRASDQAAFVFEDVHFDFDRYSLRPEALSLLNQAVSALERTPTIRLVVEGHTCSIGTTEYNLALGERRAHAVVDYLVSRGISSDRLQMVSFGEEHPKYDNSREETRRMNRRAALVVRLTPMTTER